LKNTPFRSLRLSAQSLRYVHPASDIAGLEILQYIPVVKIFTRNFSISSGKCFGMSHFWIPAFAGMTGT